MEIEELHIVEVVAIYLAVHKGVGELVWTISVPMRCVLTRGVLPARRLRWGVRQPGDSAEGFASQEIPLRGLPARRLR